MNFIKFPAHIYKLYFTFNIIGNDIGAWTPLVWACYKNHPKVVETLIRHGADVNSRGVHHVSGSKTISLFEQFPIKIIELKIGT